MKPRTTSSLSARVSPSGCTPAALASATEAFAQIIAMSATVASPIHRLAPFSVHAPSLNVAWVVMDAGSDPAVGSVSPKHPITSPLAIWGSQVCFCSSEPFFAIAVTASAPGPEHTAPTPAAPAHEKNGDETKKHS